MRQAFVHDAVVTMEAGGDVRAPGAAVTLALCGHWEHETPCPLAPHSTDAQLNGDQATPDAVHRAAWAAPGGHPLS